ncbi:5535_t:CDS:2 [Funneliformis geosporum]|uniref:14416_t:CDS:1 n=1 Tax=Funneliformis geosporum TaxID=1117311 RepID=A0A9W4WNZ1_9GLOM|nr:5535_t:CDS:2 [Funneliformis geosporum]CAI2167972.1 14416_t:CDS:2 [Funneliformis geosporum]
MSLKRILACPILSCVFCLMFAELPLIVICPTLEYFKLKYFNEFDIPYNRYVEYTVTIINLSLSSFSFATVLWLNIPIVYTIYTINELGDIPFYCPSNYDYKDPKLRTVCQVRLANLICMWLMFLGILVTGITMCIPREILIDLFNDDGIDEEYQRFNNRGDGYQSIKQNDSSNRNILITKPDEPNRSSVGRTNANGSSKQQDKRKGREETFGFNNDELQKLADDSNDDNRLKHIV